MKCPYCHKEIHRFDPYVVTTRSWFNRQLYYRTYIKNRQEFHEFANDIKGTTAIITSVKHCSIEEYNEYRG